MMKLADMTAAQIERTSFSPTLAELQIRNFAIIDELHLAFHPGLNILTGETGAGKSIIIDALGLLLGDRATEEVIRAGTERAEIEAIYHILPDSHVNGGPGVELANEIRTRLQEEGLDDPDSPDMLILSREVRRGGRNIARVNGRAVTLQLLSDLAANLVDIHGQGEHLSLLRSRTHVLLLDRYANLIPRRRAVAGKVHQLNRVRSELKRLRENERTVAQRVDLLSFQLEEIEAAMLHPGEKEELESERRRLGNAESLLELAQAATRILNQGDGESISAIDLVSEAVGRLQRLARIDTDMQPMADSGQSLLEQLSDMARDLQDYAEGLEFNPARLNEVEQRLHLIDSLQRKYGDSIEEILAYQDSAREELEELSNFEARTASLEEEEESLLCEIGELAASLSQARLEAGKRMARQVEQELSELRMNNARFGVAIDQVLRDDGAYLPDGRRVGYDSSGIDQVEFLISANPGEPLRPMARVASGGETARIMLALKSVLAHADATPILVFDEIDQGIGGRVGSVVGEKLWRLTGQLPSSEDFALADTRERPPQRPAPQMSETPTSDTQMPETGSPSITHQVLCITHLPQLAAFGDRHLTVNKTVFDDGGEMRTGTIVTAVEEDERIAELMQMLGATTDAGRTSVEEMLTQVEQVKRGTHVRSN